MKIKLLLCWSLLFNSILSTEKDLSEDFFEKIDDIPQPICTSSNKVKLALIGLGTTTITSVIAMIIYIYKCKNDESI
jgi:hypothetical protein